MTGIINECLERAYEDAVATRESEGKHGIGLAFFPIYVPVRSIEPEEISSELASLPDRFKEFEAEMIAWCFPQETRFHKGQGDKNYIPGLVMAGRSI